MPTRLHISCLILCAGIAVVPLADQAVAQSGDLGTLEYEAKSKYSHIRVRQKGDVRMLNFVRDNGREVIETMMNVKKPQDLLAPYTQSMFAALLYRPQQKRVLMIGLGGGAMVRFLHKHQPETVIDVVEIDSEVVSVAKKYFGVKEDDKVTISTQDAFAFLRKSKDTYDAIYMDAFLKPSRGTDPTGVPLRLKTVAFYRSLKARLNDGGLVVFNLNTHRTVGRDIATIRKAFQETHLFRVGGTGGLVAVATFDRKRISPTQLHKTAVDLDKQFQANFSFEKLLKTRFR